MKKRILLTVILVALLASMLIGCAQTSKSPSTSAPASTQAPPATQAAQAQVIELKLAHMDPAGSFADKHFERWAEKLSAASNGRIKIRVYPGASLVTATDTYEAVAKGLVDLGSSLRFSSPGSEFCESMSTFLAGVPNATLASKILNEVRVKFSEAYGKEWTKSKVFRISTGGPALIVTKPKAVRALEDLKGLQLRVPVKDASDALTAMGGKPVGMPMADLAVGLEKGTVDGACAQAYALKSYKIADLTKYVTEFPLYVPPDNFTVMNWDSYNKLPADLQKALDSTAEWQQQDYSAAIDAADDEGRAYAKGLNLEFITLTPAEKQRWLDIMTPVQNKIAADLDAKGYPCTEALKFIRGRIAEYVK
jgi:TRAP-type C4-dicarboxylate transport system substrate-binding protein